MAELEEAVKGLSSKPVKVVAKNKVSFKFKEKKATKEIVTSDIVQFMITGADMNVGHLVAPTDEAVNLFLDVDERLFHGVFRISRPAKQSK